MSQRCTWDEIKNIYPNEWVALSDYQLESEPLAVSGVPIAHHADKIIFYDKLKKIRDTYPHIAVRYTGKMIQNAEIPLLWQIFDTN